MVEHTLGKGEVTSSILVTGLFHSFPKNLILEGFLIIQISIHPPSPYVTTHLRDLLPSWQGETISVILVLQQAQISLMEVSFEVEQEKARLWDNLIRFSEKLADKLEDQGYFTDYFDPATGYPRRSRSGILSHNDVAAVHHALGYNLHRGKCTSLIHPLWGTAVYPGVVISAAPVEVIHQTLNHLS